uniref:MLLT6, PHD finger containing n=1 Tax=Amphiprion percula TaxID=161767 RepID=A0A3P8T3I2_AMPPE
MREMVGGCCVCSDERGWAENPLVYCDGHGCSVAVHQACYGIVQVPTGPWFCRKCESQERAARVRCELCPHKDGALKRTDSGGWAHVVCALYIPEVQFANVLTMEPIILQYVPHERYIKACYICEDHGRESKAACGACMTCNRQGCRQAFHVTCAQMAGLLCEEEGPEADNVKYCGYCKHHYNKMDFHQFSASSRLERDHDRGGDDHHSGEDRKERHRRPAVHEDEEKEEDKDEEEEEEEEEEDCKYHKPPALTPADGPLAASQSHDRSDGNSSPFENKVTISTFGSIMRITSSSGLGSSSKIRKISSSGDYKPSKSLCKQLSTPPILEEADIEDKATPPPLPRERRHRGNKKSRHGPGRPKGSKNRERRDEEHHHHHHHTTAVPAPPPPPPSLTSSLYTSPSSIPPHPAFPSSLPPAAAATSSSSFSSSSAGSFSTSRGNSLLGSGECERRCVCGSPRASCVCLCGGKQTASLSVCTLVSTLKC